MVDPRIYRTMLVLVAFALIIFGFSFQSQPGALGTTLAPAAFQGSYGTMTRLAAMFPDRRPGSPQDNALAGYIARQLGGDQFAASTVSFAARTALGPRMLQTVVATRPGLMPGTIVVLAGRDALGSPATASLSGTAVLLQLARALSGETQQRTLMLVSTSGSQGAAGATELARSLAGQQVDAVIVLGDLAGARTIQPVIVPWSNASLLAPPVLRNTLASAIATQASLRPSAGGPLAQFSHLALPLATTGQAPFADSGIPAISLSVSGERSISRSEPIDPVRIAALGQAVLQTVDALNAGPAVSAPSAYLLLGGKLVPAWAVRLLALALILPVLVAVIDALARARRRGHSFRRWVLWVLASATPFLVVCVLIYVAALTGWIAAAPPIPVWAGGAAPGAAEIALLVVLATALLACFGLLRRLLVRRAAEIAGEPAEGSPLDGAAVALMLVMTVMTVLIWVVNPFASLMVVPALHLWLWFAEPGLRARRALPVLLLVLGLLLPALVLVYYMNSLGLSAAEAAWSVVLLVAGGQIGPLAAVCWSVLLGCVASAAVIVARSFGERVHEEEPVITVRGPVTYAGPGSLGGTESALRR
jgi:hypothetical protein